MRVVVIGAGAVGLSTAYFLAERGAEVVVLDSRAPGGGASRTNAGWVVPAMSGPVPAPGLMLKSMRWMLQRQSPLSIRPSLDPAFITFMVGMLRHCNAQDFNRSLRATVALNQRTFELFDRLRASGVEFEEHRDGVTALFLDEAELAHHAEESRVVEQLGADNPVVLTGDEVRRDSPAVRRQVVGGIRSADQRYLDPDSFIEGLAHSCRGLGVEIHSGETVTAVRHRAGRVTAVESTRPWTADSFVLATGAWTSQLGKQLGLRLPIQPGKGYGYDLAPVHGVQGALYLTEGKVALTPLASRLRCAGTMEFTALDETVDAFRASGITRTADRYLAALPRPPASAWTGLRPMTPDGLPMIGPLPGYENAVVAAGHCMLGITLAPVTGHAVTSMVMDGHVPAVVAPFLPQRFDVVTRRRALAADS